jgi:hypothetical protein
MSQPAASTFVALAINIDDREKFIEYVETELLSLHEGIFVRYYISPSEFARSRKTWKQQWTNKLKQSNLRVVARRYTGMLN